MNINPSTRRQTKSILVIQCVCVVVGTIYQPVTTGELTLWGPFTGFLVGIPLVLFEVLFPLRFTRQWPFAASVLAKTSIYVALILSCFLGSTLLYGFLHGLTLADFAEAVWTAETVVKVSVSSLMYITIIFFRQLDRLLGPGTLMRYAFGRYHRPRREARIFMFLDMKGSTAIAERLDMDSYYALLNDFFHDIAEPVLATKARIYQYIGDEVVLTWLMADGLQDANCVRVFSGIDAAIEQRKSYYLDRYGLIPEYKAGVYGGEVISAEIGDLKRDLIYNGDVLNTRLLIPKALAERLTLPREMTSENVGMVALKGKKQPVELVRIRVSALNDRIVERPASVGS